MRFPSWLGYRLDDQLMVDMSASLPSLIRMNRVTELLAVSITTGTPNGPVVIPDHPQGV